MPTALLTLTAAASTVAAATTKLNTVVTGELLSGVLDEVIALLPVCVPVMIGFIGLRKGIAFVRDLLHSA